MFWLVSVQWLHVALAILWFGGSLYITLILIPALQALSREKQQEVAARISPATTRVLRPVAILVILLGFVRGTFLGRLHSVQDVFGSAYEWNHKSGSFSSAPRMRSGHSCGFEQSYG